MVDEALSQRGLVQQAHDLGGKLGWLLGDQNR